MTNGRMAATEVVANTMCVDSLGIVKKSPFRATQNKVLEASMKELQSSSSPAL